MDQATGWSFPHLIMEDNSMEHWGSDRAWQLPLTLAFFHQLSTHWRSYTTLWIVKKDQLKIKKCLLFCNNYLKQLRRGLCLLQLAWKIKVELLSSSTSCSYSSIMAAGSSSNFLNIHSYECGCQVSRLFRASSCVSVVDGHMESKTSSILIIIQIYRLLRLKQAKTQHF